MPFSSLLHSLLAAYACGACGAYLTSTLLSERLDSGGASATLQSLPTLTD
jgi:hypothetical protein